MVLILTAPISFGNKLTFHAFKCYIGASCTQINTLDIEHIQQDCSQTWWSIDIYGYHVNSRAKKETEVFHRKLLLNTANK